MEHAIKSEQVVCFVNIDFDKAYDRIHKDFILLTLADAGFGNAFRAIVKTLLANASTEVVVNGKLTNGINLACSIKHGCHLSSLLFVIAADALGWLVQKDMDDCMIKGVAIGDDKLVNELFEDDSNFLVRISDDSARNL